MNDPEIDLITRAEFIAMNREQNFGYLMANIHGGTIIINDNLETHSREIFIPSINIRFDYNLVDEFPLRFRQFVDSFLMTVMEDRSRNQVQPKRVKTVSSEHGRQYFITPKLLNGKEDVKCTICLENLLPEGKKRKKIWELGCGCKFHSGACIKKWFRQDSRCPNCRQECSDE